MRDEVAPEVRAFAHDIGHAIADDSATLSIREEPPEVPGGESGVTLLVNGAPLFWFARSEFLEAMYVAGCDVMEDLQQAGLPLAVTTSRGPLH